MDVTHKIYSVFVLEDNTCDQMILEDFLERRSFINETVYSRTIKEARELLTERNFDIYILDVNVPDGHGLELIPFIREQNPNATVVCLSGTCDTFVTDAAKHYDVVGFLIKPLTDKGLFALLEEVTHVNLALVGPIGGVPSLPTRQAHSLKSKTLGVSAAIALGFGSAGATQPHADSFLNLDMRTLSEVSLKTT